MNTYTADDFTRADFARHPDGRIAARIEPESGFPWRVSSTPGQRRWLEDEYMAADGWSPLDETHLPRVVTDEMLNTAARRIRGIRDTGVNPCSDWAIRKMFEAAWGAAPATDEDDPSVGETRLPGVVTDEGTPTLDLARFIAAWDQGCEEVRSVPHWAVNLAMALRDRDAAPTSRRVDPQMTDEDALRVAWAEYRKEHQPIEVARAHEAFCEGWKKRERWQKDAAPTTDEGDPSVDEARPSCEETEEWLDARYQAALDMMGEPHRSTIDAMTAFMHGASWERKYGYAEHSTASTTDKDETRTREHLLAEEHRLSELEVSLRAHLSRTINRAEQAEAFAALWKETARRAIRHEQAATGMASLWKRVASQTGSAREHLAAAWDAAHVPADGIIPAETAYLWRSKKDGRVVEARPDHEDARADSPVLERRLVDPPTPTTDENGDISAEGYRTMWLSADERATEAEARAEKAERQREEAERTVEALRSLTDTRTAREHLDAAWEAAHVPADGTIPAGSHVIARNHRGVIMFWPEATVSPASASGPGYERRLLDPPARPDGAEEIGELIGEWTATETAVAQVPTGSLATLADFLAERGVRVEGGAR